MKSRISIISLCLFISFISFNCSDEHISETEDYLTKEPQNEDIANSKCNSSLISKKFKGDNPEYLRATQRVEEHIQSYMDDKASKEALGQKINENTIVIPVVIHNLWLKPKHKVSNQKIQAQINIFNEDFNLANPRLNQIPNEFKGLEADIKMQFVLNKVIRKKVTQKQWKAFRKNGDRMKRKGYGGSKTVNPIKNMNIWIGNQNGGYAYFPGINRSKDGIVVGYDSFGPNAEDGRLMSHEVGHYMGLYHVWGDTNSSGNANNCNLDDFVSDTPNTKGTPLETCPNYPRTTCGSNDMTMNIMDYTSGSCQSMFTIGQKDRMRSHFAPGGFRAEMAN